MNINQNNNADNGIKIQLFSKHDNKPVINKTDKSTASPNGSTFFPKGITGLEVAKIISPSLAKKAAYISVQDEKNNNIYTVSLDDQINETYYGFAIITSDSDEFKELLHQQAADLTAQALYSIDPKITPIRMGWDYSNKFFCDFYSETQISEHQLAEIQQKALEISKNTTDYTYERMEYQEAIAKTNKSTNSISGRETTNRFIPNGEKGFNYSKYFQSMGLAPQDPAKKLTGYAYHSLKSAEELIALAGDKKIGGKFDYLYDDYSHTEVKKFMMHYHEHLENAFEIYNENNTLLKTKYNHAKSNIIYNSGKFYEPLDPVFFPEHIVRFTTEQEKIKVPNKLAMIDLVSVSAVYWQGKSDNIQFQRICGIASASKDQHIKKLAASQVADQNDHRHLGRDLDLFHMTEETPGQVLWHPKGWDLYLTIQQYIRDKLNERDYQEISTPTLVNKQLWERSGHWEKFRENMFTVAEHDENDDEPTTLAIKPMSCPCHILVFNKQQYSYKDLPLRLAEFGSCYRNEPSGALHGLMRLRNFTQDDAHIFCLPEQIEQETIDSCNLLIEIYADFGFHDIEIKFADRPEKYVGDDASWKKAEDSLKNALEKIGKPYALNKGEGAFYGPKLEFVLKDTQGKEWQCGTLQLDFALPERLDVTYTDHQAKKQNAVIIHRAILGSLERFIAILLENNQGHLPLWLSPIQITILTITNKVDEFAKTVYNKFKKSGIKVLLNNTSERIAYKIKNSCDKKIPILIVIGDKEAEQNTLTVKRYEKNSYGAETIMPIDTVIDNIKNEINKK